MHDETNQLKTVTSVLVSTSIFFFFKVKCLLPEHMKTKCFFLILAVMRIATEQWLTAWKIELVSRVQILDETVSTS